MILIVILSGFGLLLRPMMSTARARPWPAAVYLYLARGVAVFHFGWVIAILGGTPFALRLEWYWPIHVFVLTSTFIGRQLFGECPLTLLEQTLRAEAGSSLYLGSFTAHYFSYMGWPFTVPQWLEGFGFMAIVTWTVVRTVWPP